MNQFYLYNDRNFAQWIGWDEPEFATCLQVFFRLCYGIFERMCLLRPESYQEDDDYMLRIMINKIIFAEDALHVGTDVEAHVFETIDSIGLYGVYNRYDNELNKLCKNFCKADHTLYSGINDVLEELGYNPLATSGSEVVTDADIQTFDRMFDLNWAKRRADVLDKLTIAYIKFEEDVIDYPPTIDYVNHKFFLKFKKSKSIATKSIGSNLDQNDIGYTYAEARDNLTEYDELNIRIFGTDDMPRYANDGLDLAYNKWTDTFYRNNDGIWDEISNQSLRTYITNKILNGIEISDHFVNMRNKYWTERAFYALDGSYYIIELDAYGSTIPSEGSGYFLNTSDNLVYQYSGEDNSVYHGYEYTVFHYNKNGVEFYGMYKYIDAGNSSHNSEFQEIQNSSNLPVQYLNQDKIFSNGSFSDYTTPKYATFRVISYDWSESYVEVQLYPPASPTSLEDPDTMRLYAMPYYIYGTDDDDYDTSYPIRGFGATLPARTIHGYFFNTTDNYIYDYDDSTGTWEQYYHFKTVTSIDYKYYTIKRGSLPNGYGDISVSFANGVYHPFTVDITTVRSYGELKCEFELTNELKINDILPPIRHNLGEEKFFLLATVVPAAITVDTVSENAPTASATEGSKYLQDSLKTDQSADYSYCSIYEYKNGAWSEVFRVKDTNAGSYATYMEKNWGNHILLSTNHNYEYYLELTGNSYSREYLFEFDVYNNAFPITTDAFGFSYYDGDGTSTTLSILASDNPREIKMLGDSFIPYSATFQNSMIPPNAYYNPNSYPFYYPKATERYLGQSWGSQYNWGINTLLTGFQLVAKAMIIDTGDYFMATKKYG